MTTTMTIERAQIVAAARECLGTPFRHQGRVPGVGLDCVGLLVWIARRLEIPHTDRKAYTRMPDGESLMECLLQSCDVLEGPARAQEGSVLVFEFLGPKWPQHVGVKTDRGFIHTYGHVGKVVEHVYNDEWRGRTVAALDFKGVA